MDAIRIPSNIAERVCGMKFHGEDSRRELCANHSDSCPSKNRKLSMCFHTNKCDVCGYCKEHCIGHVNLKAHVSHL